MRKGWKPSYRWGILLAIASAVLIAGAARPAPPWGGTGLRPPSVDAFARFVRSLPTGDSHSLVFTGNASNRMRAQPTPATATLAGSAVALVAPGTALVIEVGAGTAFREGALLLLQHRELGHAPFTVRWAPAEGTPQDWTCGRIGAASWRSVVLELAPLEGSRGTITVSLADGSAEMDETLAITGLALVAVSTEEREQWQRMRRSLADAGAMLDALKWRRHGLEMLIGQVQRAEALGMRVPAAPAAGTGRDAMERLRGLEQRYDALHQLLGPLLLQGKADDWTAHLGMLVRDTARLEGHLTALKTRLLANLAHAGARPPVVADRSTGPPYVCAEETNPELPTGVALDPIPAATDAATAPGSPRRWAMETWPERPADAAQCRALRARLWRRVAEGTEGLTLRRAPDATTAGNGLYDPRYGNDRISPATVAACAARDEVRRLWTYFATTTPVARRSNGTGPRSASAELFVQERRAVSGRLLVLINQNPSRAVATSIRIPGQFRRATDLGIGPGARMRLESKSGTTRFPITLGPGEATLVALAP